MKITDHFLVKGLTKRKLNKVKGIVIHYVANPMSTAANNRKYWENLASGVSAHYIVDLDGSVLHCAPDSAMCYHVGAKVYQSGIQTKLSAYPNDCTIGIEMTHEDSTGKPNAKIYKSSVELAAKLLKTHGLNEKDLYLHHDITGKICHKYYVGNKTAWDQFKKDVGAILRPAPPKPVVKPVPKAVLHRVKVDGVQIGAYSKSESILEEVEKALKAGKKLIQIEKV